MTRAISHHKKPVSILHEWYLFFDLTKTWSSESDPHNNQPEKWQLEKPSFPIKVKIGVEIT